MAVHAAAAHCPACRPGQPPACLAPGLGGRYSPAGPGVLAAGRSRHDQLLAGQGQVVGCQVGLVHALLESLRAEVLGPDSDPCLLDERVALDDAVPERPGELSLLCPGDELDVLGRVATAEDRVTPVDRGAPHVRPRPALAELLLVRVGSEENTSEL